MPCSLVPGFVSLQEQTRTVRPVTRAPEREGVAIVTITITRMAAPCPAFGMRTGLPTLTDWQNQGARDVTDTMGVSHPAYNSNSANLRSNVPSTLGSTSVNAGRVRNGAAKQAAPPRGEPR